MTFENVLKQAGFRNRRPGGENEGATYFFDSPGILIEATYFSALWSLGLEAGWGIIPTYKNGRIIRFEPYYVPEVVDSYEQGLAVLSYSIGNLGEVHFGVSPDWYKQGLAFKGHLPWEIQRRREAADYDALPKVRLDIKWMRFLKERLKDWKSIIPAREVVVVHFNGDLLTFSCGDHRIPVPGQGNPWSSKYFLNSDFLDNLPKRIYESHTILVVKKDRLRFGNLWYDLVLENHTNSENPRSGQ